MHVTHQMRKRERAREEFMVFLAEFSEKYNLRKSEIAHILSSELAMILRYAVEDEFKEH